MDFSIYLFIVFVSFFALCDAGLYLNMFSNRGSQSPGKNFASPSDNTRVTQNNYSDYNEDEIKNEFAQRIFHETDFDNNRNHKIYSAIRNTSEGLMMPKLYNNSQRLNSQTQSQTDNNKIAHDPVENIIGNNFNPISKTRTKKSILEVQDDKNQKEQSKKYSNKKSKGKKSTVAYQPIDDLNIGESNMMDIRSDDKTMRENPEQNFSSPPVGAYYNKILQPSIPLSSLGLRNNKNQVNTQMHPLYIVENVDPNDHKKVKGKKLNRDSEVNYYSDYNVKDQKRSDNLQQYLYMTPQSIDYRQQNPHKYHKKQAINSYPLDNMGTEELHRNSKHFLPDQRFDNVVNYRYPNKKSKKENSRRNFLIPVTEKKFFYQAQPVVPEPARRTNGETIYYIN